MTTDKREVLAQAFGQTLDPLARHEPKFRELEEQYGIDPFEMFIENVLDNQTGNEGTRNNYLIPIRQWRDFMDSRERHPACPSENHVRDFALMLLEEKELAKITVRQKLTHLNRVFRYWQTDAAFPHGGVMDGDEATDSEILGFNPFKAVLDKMDLEYDEPNDPPPLTVKELQDILEGVKHWRDRLIIGLQLKLGLRAGELVNIQLQDINIPHTQLNDQFPSFGDHPRIKDHKDAIYIPSGDEREGNKSKVGRIMPLDDEAQHLIIEYLFVRPDNGKPWLLLSPQFHGQWSNSAISEVWREHFWPEYEFDEGGEFRSITSHYGRHYFSTWFGNHLEYPEHKLNYMRGDKTSKFEKGALASYLHTYYEDIRKDYLKDVYPLGVL